MDSNDLASLWFLRNYLIGDGNVTPRDYGVNAYRYRTMKKATVILILSMINGRVRHDARQLQVVKLCNLYGIPVKEITPLIVTQSTQPCELSYYYAGLFDADGSVAIGRGRSYAFDDLRATESERVGRYAASVGVSNKYPKDLLLYIDAFKGDIAPQTNSQGHLTHTWKIANKEGIIEFRDYYLATCSPSKKRSRMLLLDTYYSLLLAHAHLPSAPEHFL